MIELLIGVLLIGISAGLAVVIVVDLWRKVYKYCVKM